VRGRRKERTSVQFLVERFEIIEVRVSTQPFAQEEPSECNVDQDPFVESFPEDST